MTRTNALNPLDTIAGLNEAYRTGATTPSETVARYLDRIDRLDLAVGAFQDVWRDSAMQAAEAADRAIAAGYRTGPFHGIPFALKDIFHVEGTVTTCGSKAMADHVSKQTGTVVKRLIAAGGIILGKTKTVECAFGAWGTNQKMGTPMNPWDMDTPRIPGGSSSGSATAVAAGMAPCGIGSDTGGSVRLPAALCGIVGLKLTQGILPLDGIMSLSHTLDTPGPIVQSVLDSLILFDVMDGREGWRIDEDMAAGQGLYGMLNSGAAGLKIGLLSDEERAVCTPDVLAAYDAAVETLRSLGADCSTFTAPFGYGDLADLNGAITAVEGFTHHGHLYDDPTAPMDEDVRARMLKGKPIPGSDYVRCLLDRQDRIAEFLEAMKGYDALLTPATMTPPIPVADVDQTSTPAYFSRPFNFLEMCGIALPVQLNQDGLPIAVQVAARPNDEAMAVRVAAALEGALPPLGRPDLG